MKKTILHLSESSETGGAETVMLRLVMGIDSQHFNSIVVLMKTGWLEEQFRSRGITPHVLDSSQSYDVAFLRRLIGVIRKYKVDLVHSHLPDSNAYGCLAGLFTRVPVVATYHGLIRTFGEPTYGDKAKLLIVRTMARRVVAVSNTMRDDLIQTGGFAGDRVTVVHNGIDWAPLDHPFDREEMRRELACSENDRLVGMVANLKPVKGYDCFIRAAAKVVLSRGDVTFLVMGEDENGHQEELRKKAESLGVAHRIKFLGFRSDVGEIVRSLDVYVLSSHSEAHPLATVEAMAAGTPAVASRIGGHEEIMEDGVSGFLVAPEDDSGFAERILHLLCHRDEAAAMAGRARAVARERFGLDTMIRAYSNIYVGEAR